MFHPKDKKPPRLIHGLALTGKDWTIIERISMPTAMPWMLRHNPGKLFCSPRIRL